MTSDQVCPYFHNESGCDVAEDYISPHDVETIVGFCNGRYAECMTYRLITEHGMEATQHSVQEERFADRVADTSLSSLSLGSITVIGLMLGLSLLLDHALIDSLTTVSLLAGGLVLIVHGVHDWRQDKAFPATVNCAYGLFAESLIPLLVLPRIGMSATPDPWGTTSYLAMWGLFSIAIYITTFENDRLLGSAFGLLTAAILTTAVATAIDSNSLIQSAGGLFMASGIVALFPKTLRERGTSSLTTSCHS